MGPRERLLEAAIRLLHERGYARITTREIVAAAGAHLPAVNYYFGSKERLLDEAIVEALGRWAQSTMTVADEPGGMDPSERLLRSIERFFATLEADRAYVVAAVEAFAQAERSEELRRRLADAYLKFRGVVARNIQSAAGSEDAPLSSEASAIASVLIALFDGLAIQWLLDPENVPPADRILQSLETLGRGIAPGPRA